MDHYPGLRSHLTIGEVADLTWIITVENSGNITLTDIEIRDVLVAAQDQPLDSCARTVASLNPGAEWSYDCTVTDREITVAEFANVAIVEALAVNNRVLTVLGAAVVRSAASIAAMGGTAFSDDNRNGIHDAGEAGIAGIPVILTDNHGATPVSINTDSAGGYLFSDLPVGTYTVTAQPGGFSGTLTTASAYTTALAANEQSLGNDFGINATLPATGADIDRQIGFGMTLVLLGAIFVIATRRRDQRPFAG
jgi:hypothetical protein